MNRLRDKKQHKKEGIDIFFFMLLLFHNAKCRFIYKTYVK